MTLIGTFQSARWGTVRVSQARYLTADGPICIHLDGDEGPLAKLSVNMVRPQALHDSRDLPPGCFYVKDWEPTIAELAHEALAAGLFKERLDLPSARSGHVSAPVWQLAGSVA